MHTLASFRRSASLGAALCTILAAPPQSALAQSSSLVRDAESAEVAIVPEGTFLIRQRCEMRRLGARGWFVVFAQPEEGPPLPPMILQPCANLQAMEQLAASDDGVAQFLVSGQVFLFDDRNYLLPTLFASDDTPATESALRDELAEEPEGFATDPSVQDLIARLEESTSLDESQAPAAPAPAIAGLMREGSIIASRPGRIESSDQGGWRLVFDSDADSTSEGAYDAPVELLPCLHLALMRDIVNSGIEPLFEVSGRVFIYDGRNYLLPTIFMQVRERETGLSTAQ